MQSHWPSGSHIKQSKQEKQTKAPEERRPEREARRSASRRRRRHFPSSCPSPSHHCQGNTWLFYTAEIRTQARSLQKALPASCQCRGRVNRNQEEPYGHSGWKGPSPEWRGFSFSSAPSILCLGFALAVVLPHPRHCNAEMTVTSHRWSELVFVRLSKNTACDMENVRHTRVGWHTR